MDWLPQLAGKVASGGRLNLAKAVDALPRDGAQGIPPAGPAWSEEPISVVVPARPVDLLDLGIKIQKAGARAIQLHVRFASVDSLDSALLFDGAYFPITRIADLSEDVWLPPVLGDTAYLKFANAKVALQKFRGEIEVENPEMIPEKLSPLCFKKPEGTLYTCLVYDEPGAPRANFLSEGIEIDRIRFAR